MNKVFLLGRLTRDPEMKQLSNGKNMTRFNLAVDRPKTAGQERAEADFINCVAWDKTANLIAQYFAKGSRIMVEGTLRVGSYNNKDNVKVTTTDVWVNSIEFVDSRKQKPQQQASPMSMFGEESQITPFDEEIPF